MKKLLCFLFGHKYQLEKYFNSNNQKLNCKRCNEKFGINHPTKSLLKWDSELQSLYKN